MESFDWTEIILVVVALIELALRFIKSEKPRTLLNVIINVLEYVSNMLPQRLKDEK